MGADEKHAQEVRRLRRDLSEAQDKVHTLTSQLSTNVSKIVVYSLTVLFLIFYKIIYEIYLII